LRFRLSSMVFVAFVLAAASSPGYADTLDRRARVHRVARSWKGIRYVFGGSSKSGVDCSGLTMRVYERALGIRLPHSSAAQARYGTHPGWKRAWKIRKLKRGDLLFWKGTYQNGISHVGIYVGHGHSIMAHGPGSRSSRTEIRSSYYVSHWAFAVRPPPLRS
jgi:cell wall-associated NlpC family hydrolase